MAQGVPASTVLVPAPDSLGALRRSVLNWVQGTDDTAFLNTARDAINSGIDSLNVRNWNKLLKQQEITLVADTKTYSLESDFRAPRHLQRLDSSDNFDGKIYYKELDTMLKEHSRSTQSGTSAWYTTDSMARELMFNVAPSSSFVSQYPKVNLWYHFRHPHLAEADDQLTYPSEFGSYVLWYARAEVAGLWMPKRESKAQSRATAILKALMADDHDTLTDWE